MRHEHCAVFRKASTRFAFFEIQYQTIIELTFYTDYVTVYLPMTRLSRRLAVARHL
jgi:hypothetical protein